MKNFQTYLISYDLPQKGQDYDGLAMEIESLGNARRILTTTWILKSSKFLPEVYNALYKYIDHDNDKLLITKLTSQTRTYGFEDEDAAWLESIGSGGESE